VEIGKKRRNNKVNGNNNNDDDLIIDKIDCLQRDLAGFKGYLLQYIDEAIYRALKELRKPKPYIERGYRS
jgi:hypothetical protein